MCENQEGPGPPFADARDCMSEYQAKTTGQYANQGRKKSRSSYRFSEYLLGWLDCICRTWWKIVQTEFGLTIHCKQDFGTPFSSSFINLQSSLAPLYGTFWTNKLSFEQQELWWHEPEKHRKIFACLGNGTAVKHQAWTQTYRLLVRFLLPLPIAMFLYIVVALPNIPQVLI